MGGFLRGGEEDAGREGRAGAGGRDEGGNDKGRHLPGGKGRPFGEGGEANYS